MKYKLPVIVDDRNHQCDLRLKDLYAFKKYCIKPQKCIIPYTPI